MSIEAALALGVPAAAAVAATALGPAPVLRPPADGDEDPTRDHQGQGDHPEGPETDPGPEKEIERKSKNNHSSDDFVTVFMTFIAQINLACIFSIFRKNVVSSPV